MAAGNGRSQLLFDALVSLVLDEADRDEAVAELLALSGGDEDALDEVKRRYEAMSEGRPGDEETRAAVDLIDAALVHAHGRRHQRARERARPAEAPPPRTTVPWTIAPEPHPTAPAAACPTCGLNASELQQQRAAASRRSVLDAVHASQVRAMETVLAEVAAVVTSERPDLAAVIERIVAETLGAR